MLFAGVSEFTDAIAGLVATHLALGEGLTSGPFLSHAAAIRLATLLVARPVGIWPNMEGGCHNRHSHWSPDNFSSSKL